MVEHRFRKAGVAGSTPIFGSISVLDSMAHKRKDTLTKPPEWWKHLRPYNKRRVAKRERLAARRQINAEHEAKSELPEQAP